MYIITLREICQTIFCMMMELVLFCPVTVDLWLISFTLRRHVSIPVIRRSYTTPYDIVSHRACRQLDLLFFDTINSELWLHPIVLTSDPYLYVAVHSERERWLHRVLSILLCTVQIWFITDCMHVANIVDTTAAYTRHQFTVAALMCNNACDSCIYDIAYCYCCCCWWW